MIIESFVYTTNKDTRSVTNHTQATKHTYMGGKENIEHEKMAWYNLYAPYKLWDVSGTYHLWGELGYL